MPGVDPSNPSGNPSAMPNWMKYLIPALGGFAAGGQNQQNQNQSGTGTTNTWGDTSNNSNITSNNWLRNFLNTIGSTDTSGTTSTNPNFNPTQQAFIDKLTGSYSNLARPVDLTGYQAGQIQGINTNADLASQSANNIMAARGLSTSPAAATTATNIDSSRIAGINTLNQSLPILQNQLTNSNLGTAANFMSMIPHGTTTTQVGSTQQQQNQTQDQTSGAVNSSTGWTGSTGGSHNEQQQQSKSGSGGGIMQAAGGIAALLASLFSDERLKDDIKEIPTNKAVEKIMALRPSSWKWKGSEVEDTGLIAQELRKVMPELVNPDESGINRVNYAGLIGTLVSAIQGINNKIEAEAT